MSWVKVFPVLLLVLAGCATGSSGGDTPNTTAAMTTTTATTTTVAPATTAPTTTIATTTTMAAATPAPGNHRLSLRWDGEERSAIVHAPPDFAPDEPTPLVVAMHGASGTGEEFQTMTKLDTLADEEGFVVAYPISLGRGFSALICCGAEDDVGFVGELVSELVDTWGIDPDRVYATGFSNGGDMSFRLAVEASDLFAAVAPVSGGYLGSRTMSGDFIPPNPVSVITIIGAEDSNHSSYHTGLQLWQEHLGCTETLPNEPFGDSGRVFHSEWECPDGSDLSIYNLTAMDHRWPGGSEGEDWADATQPVSANQLMWEFFQAHPKE